VRLRQRKTDSNQAAIVKAFRQIGASVQSLHTVGQGCPDLLVGVGGRNLLIEVKDGLKKPSARGLTADQDQWHKLWRGAKVHVVESMDDALRIASEERRIFIRASEYLGIDPDE
jgi:hypothetical protein